MFEALFLEVTLEKIKYRTTMYITHYSFLQSTFKLFNPLLVLCLGDIDKSVSANNNQPRWKSVQNKVLKVTMKRIYISMLDFS